MHWPTAQMMASASSPAEGWKSGAEQGIDSVNTNAPLDDHFEREASTKGEPFFNLKASHGQVIGHSEMYSTAGSMENGMASVKKNAPAATVVDKTA